MRTLLAAIAAALLVALPASGSTPGARVLFTEGPGASSDVVALDADGTSYTNLTPGQQTFYVSDSEPSWSPDGARIVFTSHRDSNVGTEIYTMNADGSGAVRLTHDGPDGVQNSGGDVFDGSPRWSPAGDAIAYLKSVKGNTNVWMMRPDGSGQHPLTADGDVKSNLSWSPDGTRLLYQTQEGPKVVETSGDGAPRRIAPNGLGAVWSPDGTRIAYTDDRGLWTVGANGDGATRVTSIVSFSPSWSPDGSQLAFVGTRFFPHLTSRFGVASRQDVYSVRVDGSGLRRLTGPATDDYPVFPSPAGSLPAWWPDGSRVFFLSQRGSGPATTYEMNADGTCEQRFAETGTGLIGPAWRPGSAPGLGPLRCVDLRITPELKGGVVTPTGLGQEAAFSFAVDNDGTQTATGVHVEIETDKPNLTLRGGDVACTGASLDIVCALPPIPPGTSQTFGIVVSSRVAGNYAFTASVTAVERESDPTTNAIQTVVSVLPCTTVGTSGPDVLYGTAGPDKICALPGPDRVYGRAGNDVLDAGNGDDIVVGGPGTDTILARGGNDTVYARDGQRDWIDCGSERDVAIVDRVDITRHCESVVRR